MSRNEQFIAGQLSHRDPRELHPNINHYRDGGMGGEGDDKSVVGYMSVQRLSQMHGNETDHEGIQRHKDALLSGRGFTDPVMVEFDPKNKRAVLGEGNHRTAAARQLGISHIPTRVIRSRISDGDVEYMSRKGGSPVSLDPGESPWKGNLGEDYWPSDIHPRHLFKDDVL